MPKLNLQGIDGTAEEPLTSTTIEQLLTDEPSIWTQVLDRPQGAGDLNNRPLQTLLTRLPSLAPKIQSGLDLYTHLRDNVRILPSGCDPLDAILRGGLREGLLTEICGESGSGKTQLCLLATATTAHRNERVIYFDTTNSFSATRLEQLHSHLPSATPDHDQPTLSLPSTLANITVLQPHSYYHLCRQLDETADQLQQLQEPTSRPTLLVVDSISALLSPVLGSRQHSMGLALTVAVGRTLRALAETFKMAVLVTNHTVSGRQQGLPTKPALGEHWKSQPHVQLVLWVVLEAGAGARCVKLTSSTFSEVGQQAWFRLGAEGAVGLQP